VVEVASLVLARRRRRKLFERTEHWIIYTARRRRKQFCFLGGSKGCNIYTFFTQLPQAKKFGSFWGQNDAIYTHFGGQNGSMYTHFGYFFWSKCYHIYTFLEFNFSEKTKTKKKQYLQGGIQIKKTDSKNNGRSA
jgi:hypothetical protein